MSSVKSRFSFSNEDGDEIQSSLLCLFNGQDTNGNGSNNSKEDKEFKGKKNSIEEIQWHQMKGPNGIGFTSLINSSTAENVKVLLVFAKGDRQLRVLALAGERLGWQVSETHDIEEALELFQTHGHDIVIIDRRGLYCQQADELCIALNNINHHRTCIIIALVKESLFFTSDQADEAATSQIYDKGYNKVLMECLRKEIIVNEFIGIYANEVRPRLQLANSYSLYLAVNKCRDMVHVTNDQHQIQFANEVSERLLGYKPEELLNKNITELVTCDNFSLMNQRLQKGWEFHGNMNWKRKSNETIIISSRIIPFRAYDRSLTHYIYIYDTTYLLENFDVTSSVPNPITHLHPRGSSHSLRSFDVGSINSDLQRRSSVAKIHNLPLEAPITKVITLLTSAMTEAVSPDVATQIDKAIEILKTTELYAPYVRETDELFNDPVTSDLIGALISAPQYSRDSRRSSNDSLGRVSQVQRILHQQPLPKPMSKSLKTPRDIELLLESCMEWDFDIFKLEQISGKRPLYYLGMNLMNRYEATAHLNCDERTLQNWLTVIEVNYNSQNSYHNSTHAADVLQAIARYINSERLKMLLDPLDEVAALVAAAAHDIDHPGKSSQFLCNAGNKLAILYNDLSVLESHHAALTFKLTLSDDDVNIFKNLDRETYKMIRQNIIDMILATEMTKHFEHLAKFVNVFSIRTEESQSEPFSDPVDSSVLLLPENVSLVKRMMIKCADVSNPTRPLKFCIEWTKRIAEEYFRQTDEEKKKKATCCNAHV